MQALVRLDVPERELLFIYRGLNEHGQEMLLGTAKAYKSCRDLQKVTSYE